jgi:L-ribulose-5-phosphate 4-epimerase
VSGYADLRERVLDANLALVDAGLVVLTFGNASAVDRAAGVLGIKPSGVPYDRLRVDDVAVVDLESGTVVEGETRPSSDTPTHLALYQAWSDVGGIVHTHSEFATAWAQARRELPCFGTTHADHFGGAVPVTRALTPAEIEGDYERETGDVIIETFAELELRPLDVPAALVVSHGPFTWGDTVEHAVENAIALEAVAASAYRSVVLARELETIQAELLEKHFSRKHGASAYYGQPT